MKGNDKKEVKTKRETEISKKTTRREREKKMQVIQERTRENTKRR